MTDALEPLRHSKTILLTTYKRDGTPVATPVSIAFDGDRAFFRTYHKAGKTKRLRNNPQLEAAPCTLRGHPRPSRSFEWRRRPSGRALTGAGSSRAASSAGAATSPLDALPDAALRAPPRRPWAMSPHDLEREQH